MGWLRNRVFSQSGCCFFILSERTSSYKKSIEGKVFSAFFNNQQKLKTTKIYIYTHIRNKKFFCVLLNNPTTKKNK